MNAIFKCNGNAKYSIKNLKSVDNFLILNVYPNGKKRPSTITHFLNIISIIEL